MLCRYSPHSKWTTRQFVRFFIDLAYYAIVLILNGLLVNLTILLPILMKISYSPHSKWTTRQFMPFGTSFTRLVL